MDFLQNMFCGSALWPFAAGCLAGILMIILPLMFIGFYQLKKNENAPTIFKI